VIKKAEFYNFRNYQNLFLNLGSNLNVFIGDNGQGKTNFVEGINLLLTGDYLRSKKISDLVYLNQKQSYIACEWVEKTNKTTELRLTLNNNKKTHYIDQKQVTQHAIKQKYPVVIFTPESLSAIKHGPEIRRELIDDLVTKVYPLSVPIYANFNKILFGRNKTLKAHREGAATLPETQDILHSLNPIYFKLAARIVYLRLKATEAITPFFQNAAFSLFQYDYKPRLIYYMSRQAIVKEEEQVILKKLVERSIQLRSSELNSGLSLVGPHKHEIEINFNNQNARSYCSQGQQRTLILAFKMAQIVYHRQIFDQHPILILDDVLSELDEKRSQDLVQFLQEIQTQVFMTTTQIEKLEKNIFKNLKLFEAIEGQMRERL